MSELPRAGIDPDRSKGWLRRLLPLVRAHRRLVAISLTAALASQLLLVSAPRRRAARGGHGLPQDALPDQRLP